MSVIEAEVQQTARNSEHTAMRWNRKTLWMTAEVCSSLFSRCASPFLLMLMLDVQVPPHILTVHQRSDPSKRFIAKKVGEEPNELEIFKLLNSFQPKCEHILSLHESFQTQSMSWAILPK